ncbi:hypothetical protein BJ165DRAFT_1410005 [Panaeolus papilionaceus]|nr:hypothetical protein BJ165DRAFT_1410005 [Panaeolus papilionaceus]
MLFKSLVSSAIIGYLATISYAYDGIRDEIPAGARLAELPDPAVQPATLPPCSFIRVLHIRLGHAIRPRLRPKWMDNSRLRADCIYGQTGQPSVNPVNNVDITRPISPQLDNSESIDGGSMTPESSDIQGDGESVKKTIGMTISKDT